MKLLSTLLYTVILSAAGFAQDTPAAAGPSQAMPVCWQFSAQKISEGWYELHLEATVQSPWHTYSQATPDGGPLPTKIIFTRNPLVKTEGKVSESGDLRTMHDNTFAVDVKYFRGNVDFVQRVQVKGRIKTKITGTVTFMACNDEQCLPPKTIPFTIQLQ